MWNWIRNSRRQAILEKPFPPEWAGIMRQNVAHYGVLSAEKQQHLRHLVQVFIEEKKWEGCGGLVITDEIRVTVACEACFLVLEIPHNLFENVESIFVYPTTTWRPSPKPGFFEVRQAPLPEGQAILGEAWRGGPVVLAWDEAKRSARHPESGRNLIYHEFAHKLDMQEGRANGAPVLEDAGLQKRWAEVCSREFQELRTSAAKGKHTTIDPYGATNEAEFFAVVTEKFFDQPASLKKHSPELYDVFRLFYRQDPAAYRLTRS